MPLHSHSEAASTPPSRVLSPVSSDGHGGSRSPTASLRALELEQGPAYAGGHGLQRTNTLLSMGGFEFEQTLLPLSLSTAEGDMSGEQHVEHKHVGLLHGGL